MSVSIAWFRRDLRVSDNQMLRTAIDAADEVVPLFVLDDTFWKPAGPNRRWFLSGALESLNEALDGRLVVRHGDPANVIPALIGETSATYVFRAQDVGVAGRERDANVADALADSDVELVEADSPFAVPAGTLHTGSGSPFKVYTPYLEAWRRHDPGRPMRAPSSVNVPDGLESDGIPRCPDVSADLPEPGEVAARTALDRFLRHDVDDYATTRDRPADDRTSRLSPYLHFGCVHPRQILARLDTRMKGHAVFATELAWRDFYGDVLHHTPESAWSSWNESMAKIRLDTGKRADEHFDAWCHGETGFPIVDAGMRQLLGEGWMHNRLRMITASFLVKDLHVDWTRGARYFLQQLVDGDLSSNNHGWQWVAGTGTDAAPYFRIFNPTLQSTKFDPDGAYIRRWVPELADVEAKYVHEPSKHPDGVPNGYPAPIIDHAVEREEALRRYDEARSGR